MNKKHRLAVAMAALALASGGVSMAAQLNSFQQEAKMRVLDRLEAKVKATGKPMVVIARIDDQGAFTPGQATDQDRLSAAQDEVLAKLGGSVKNVKKLKSLPFIAYTVDSDGLAQMRDSDSGVWGVQENRAYPPTLAQSVPLTHASAAWGKGYTGDGQIVMVVDTGVDRSHPFLTGKLQRDGVALEACISNEWPDQGVYATCPGGVTTKTGQGAAAPCTDSEQCAHGTHVAGIIAGKNATFSGVAPDAKIFAVQATSAYYDQDICGDIPTPCYLFADWNVIDALDYAHLLKTQHSYPIAAVNMSLGGGEFTGNCDTEFAPYTEAMAAVKAAGIAPVVAMGNDGFKNKANFPGCISHAVSVGSVCDTTNASECPRGPGSVVDSSNIYPYTSILAPGAWINSSVPGGTYQNWSGTSMATPHVAGAFALMKERNPQATVNQILNELRTNGKATNDTRPGGTQTGLKRLDLSFLGGTTSLVDTRIKVVADDPIANAIMTGSGTLRGYATGPEGIKYVQYYIDGVVKPNIAYGGRRNDVGNLYPSYPNAINSGWSQPFVFGSLAAGKHVLRVRAVAPSGKYNEVAISFNVVKFHKAFFANQASMDLSAATVSKANGKILINNAKMDGQLYNLQLQWLKTPQDFNIISIQKK